MFAKPYKTLETTVLIAGLHDIFSKEKIQKIVIGYPRTMRGTISEQTKKVEEAKLLLEKEFPDKQFILWDERLSSKRADLLSAPKLKKIRSNPILLRRPLFLKITCNLRGLLKKSHWKNNSLAIAPKSPYKLIETFDFRRAQ